MLKALKDINNEYFTNDHLDQMVDSIYNNILIDSSLPNMVSAVKVIDDDFEEIVPMNENESYNSLDVCFLIDVYVRRNLPVAINLIRAMSFRSKEMFDDLRAMRSIFIINEVNPKFLPYKEEIEKYLALQ
jgi:hypothetical protein